MIMKTRFCLIRHGETAWNAERRIQGQIDIPLNAKGRRQAAAAGRSLAAENFAAAYSSDLKRARATAVALTDQPVLAEADLRERHYGVMQALTLEEAGTGHPEIYRRYLARDLHCELDGGESLAGFARRVMLGLEAIARRHVGQTVLVVTHGGVLDIVYRSACGRGLDSPRDFPIPNAGLNWLERDAGAWHILRWADQSHLQEVIDELPG